MSDLSNDEYQELLEYLAVTYSFEDLKRLMETLNDAWGKKGAARVRVEKEGTKIKFIFP